jgi:hypothetical protein
VTRDSPLSASLLSFGTANSGAATSSIIDFTTLPYGPVFTHVPLPTAEGLSSSDSPSPPTNAYPSSAVLESTMSIPANTLPTESSTVSESDGCASAPMVTITVQDTVTTVSIPFCVFYLANNIRPSTQEPLPSQLLLASPYSQIQLLYIRLLAVYVSQAYLSFLVLVFIIADMNIMLFQPQGHSAVSDRDVRVLHASCK